MKKLLLLPLVGLVAAGCSTTEYYQDDLAVAQMLNDDAPTQPHLERLEKERQQGMVSRAAYEQSRDLKEVEARLDEIDSRISALETEMGTMSDSEREQTAAEVSELRDQQRRAESMLRDAEQQSPGAFVEVRDELRNAVNALEIGVYRALVRDSAQPATGETIP